MCSSNNVCVSAPAGSGGTTAAGGTFAATGGARVTGGTSAIVNPCTTGTLNCQCYTSGLCSSGLTCNAEKICVSSATGGSGALGSGGRPAGGSPSTASGGRPAVGGSFATGGTSAASSSVDKCKGLTLPTATPAPDGALDVISGYATAGTLAGYAWVVLGSSSNAATCVSPTCNSAGCSPAMSSAGICAVGVVAADPVYNSTALIGFNLKQASAGGSNSALPVDAPNSVTIYAHAGNGLGDKNLLVALVTTDYETYCVDAGDWAIGQPIAISDFKITCQGNPGAALAAGAGITEIMLMVPSDGVQDSPFSVCLEGVVFGS